MAGTPVASAAEIDSGQRITWSIFSAWIDWVIPLDKERLRGGVSDVETVFPSVAEVAVGRVRHD